MKENTRNIVLLFLLSLLFLTCYLGFYNYILVNYLSSSSSQLSALPNRMDILVMGFENPKAMAYFALIAFLFAIIGQRFLARSQNDGQLRTALVLTVILVGLFTVYRCVMTLAGGYFSANTVNNILKSILVLLPLSMIVILTLTFLLKRKAQQAE